MSTLTSYTSANRPAASSNTGLCIFRSDTEAIEVSDGTDWLAYNNDGATFIPIANTKSVLLDGVDDYVLIPSNASYGFGTGDFSIICWFNADIIGAASYNALYDFRTASSSSHPSFFVGTPSGTRYYFYNGSTIYNYNVTPATGQWFMSAVVRSGTTTTVYQNQNSVASGTDTRNYATPTNGIRVGLHFQGTLDFDGYMDEFAIWDKALTANQITSIYNDGNPIDLDDLGASNQPLTWLRMGDGDTGSTVIDHGSLGNDASLQNDAQFSTASVP